MLSRIVSAWRRSARIRFISREIASANRGYPGPTKALAKQLAEEQLISLVERDSLLQSILKRHNATGKAVRAVYAQLEAHGADRLVRGHWVAASALAFGSSLDFLLRKTSNGTESDDWLWTEAASRLLFFFRGGGGIRL